MTVAAGTRLGPYEIVSAVGAGGMGEVYRARDTRLERTVAIKVLPEHLSKSEEVRQRFEREAKTISQLSHPHICALYDVGNQDGVEYLVMEFLEGETLAHRLGAGPLTLEQTIRYGIEIADALDKAHRQGIVHRDLKPGNVMLTTSGVKLLDFGLAKMVQPISPASKLSVLPTQAKANLTQEGTLLGTLQYMAPEQLEGREADARTDVFALGALLYEMATGRKAFTGASQASLISAILRDEPQPVSQARPMTPPALDRIVRICLAKNPDERWQSTRDVALQLAEVSASAAGTPAATGRSGRLPWGAAGWVIAALVALAGLFFPWARAPGPPSSRFRFLIPPPQGAAFVGMLALSPNGRTLAFVATGQDGRDLLFLRPLDSLNARALEGSEGAAFPFWSPDGRSVAFFAEGKLRKIDVSSGSAQTLCDAPSARGGSWGSSGTIVFSAESGGQMRAVSETGGQPRPIPHLASRIGESYRWPSFLPDGRHFLYFALREDERRTGVSVTSLDSKEDTLLASAESGGVYTAPGSLFYRTGDRLVARPFDARRLRLTGEAVTLVEDVWWDGISTFATAFTVSSNGVLAYQTGGLAVTRLILYDRAGREIRTLGPPGAYLEPAVSPDGSRLAVARSQAGALGVSVWMIGLERGSLTRATFQSSFAQGTPLWMPDGRRILFSSYPSGEVFLHDADGFEKDRVLFKPPAFSPLDDISRDGRWLFLEVVDWPSFHFNVTLRDLRDGSERPLLKEPFNQMGARLSPDGRWLAYESEESGAREVFVRSFPGPGDRRQVSAGGGTQPRWRGDGKELFYVSADRKLMAVEIRAEPVFEAGVPRALFQTRIIPTIEARNHYDVTSDGERFVVNSRRPEDASLPITVVTGGVLEPGK